MPQSEIVGMFVPRSGLKARILLLDNDGTLIKPKSGDEFVQHPEDQVLIDGAAESIARYRSEGWLMGIVSNQGGVAAGHKTLSDCIDEMFFAMRLCGIEYALAAYSAEDKGYGEALWLDLSDGGQQWKIITNAQRCFRKPATGMIDYLCRYLLCASSWRVVADQVLMVGDRPEDAQAAQAAGIEFMWASDWREVKQ
ncbi:MAG: HAD hydrolase-like protein [Cyanobacteria bacterium J06638_20]